MAEHRMQTRALRHPKPKCHTAFYEIINKVGGHLTSQDVEFLRVAAGRKIEERLKSRIKTGRDFLAALAESASCDETDFENVIELLKLINRHDLFHKLLVRGKTKVPLDPVEEYLKKQIPQGATDEGSQSNQTLRIGDREHIPPSLDSPSTSEERVHFTASSVEPPNKRRRRNHHQPSKNVLHSSDSSSKLYHPSSSNQKYTCGVRLRVRAEYCDYEAILQANVSSNKQDPLERQADCFNQAYTLLRTRDLGYIVCDIKFSEIAYLDAFWRDYLNGSLLEALKGVFITETLKQAVGNESIKLLVNVDEDDYERGRNILLKNLREAD